jgi:DNA-directed RNA polymerase specialized sigma24 family protein
MSLAHSFELNLYAIGFKLLRGHWRKAAFRATFLGVARQFLEPAAQHTTEAAVSLRHALRKLGRTDREILFLREFEGLSYAEIAELLSLPMNTVRSRLFRARMALRELLTAPAVKTASREFAESEGRV